MASHILREALIDVQTILIVGFLYWFFREEQSNAYLRTWLSQNFPLGLYLLAPLTVAAISGTLLVITAVRILLFVTNKNLPLRLKQVLGTFGSSKKKLRVFITMKSARFSALILTSFGLAFSFYSYFLIGVIPFVALGISSVILGFTIVSLPRHVGGPGMRAILQGAALSLEVQLEPLAVRKATYLPPDKSQAISAYIPLSSEGETLSLNEMRQAPRNLGGNDQKSVLVYPIGSELMKVEDFDDKPLIGERLSYVLVDSANLCSRVVAQESGNHVIVGMKDADLNLQGQKYLESLGSLPSSLAACVIVMLRNRAVTLVEEKRDGKRTVAIFRVLG